MKFLKNLLFALLISCCFTLNAEDVLLDYEAWDGKKADDTKVEVYQPYPIIFVHGFAGGGPSTWNEVVTVFEGHFDGTYKPAPNSLDNNQE